MRLLKVSSVELEDFQPGKIPPYAILSHRWGDPKDEVLFLDVGTKLGKSKKAYQKVLKACQHAQKDGYEYIWIDTLCIDKSSSAELSEAINSMYEWYSSSKVCYAFLPDVSCHSYTPGSDMPRLLKQQFSSSSWFSRGWTLQELLAPSTVIFYDAEWRKIGTKSQLRDQIFDATRIGLGYLEGWAPIQSASIAQRMSWMAKRKTTRPEDVAYCLLGIFSVNMPLLYGEGDRAFIRLQEEIMKNSNDQSILAWTPEGMSYPTGLCGILAPSPIHFRQTATIAPCVSNDEPYSITNRGLRLSLHLRRKNSETTPHGDTNVYVGVLNCTDLTWPWGSNRLITIPLARIRPDSNDFLRSVTSRPLVTYVQLGSIPQYMASDMEKETIYIQVQHDSSQSLDSAERQFVRINLLPRQDQFALAYSKHAADKGFKPVFKNSVFEIPNQYGWCSCAMLFQYNPPAHEDTDGGPNYILVTIGSNFPSHLRVGHVHSDGLARDRNTIGFDADVIDDAMLEDGVWPTALRLYTPHSVGLELFVGDFAIRVSQGLSHSIDPAFDPTVPRLDVIIRKLTSMSQRPVDGAKWQLPAVSATEEMLELDSPHVLSPKSV